MGLVRQFFKNIPSFYFLQFSLCLAHVVRRVNETTRISSTLSSLGRDWNKHLDFVDLITSASTCKSSLPIRKINERCDDLDILEFTIPHMPTRYSYPVALKPLLRPHHCHRPLGLSSRNASIGPYSQPIKVWPFVAIFCAGTGIYMWMVKSRAKEAEQRQEKLRRSPSITSNGK